MGSNIEFRVDEKTIGEIVGYYEKGQINLEPGFQRSSVWRITDRKKLIDSILRNYPMPSIFLYKHIREDGEMVYDIIDGKQRLESIFMFMGQIRGGKFRVKLENNEWVNWKIIKQRHNQYKIIDYKIQTIVVDGELGDIVDLFVKINSTGKALTGAEKRHAKYYKSEFLKKAAKLSEKFEDYFLSNNILSKNDVSRMKHIELICELMISSHCKDVINKKESLDKVMANDSICGQDLKRCYQNTDYCLKKLRKMFPEIKHTRFRKISDFYTLAVLVQKFHREGFILDDRKRNNLAWDILKEFSISVDNISELIKKAKPALEEQEIFRDYYLTVQRGTDEINQRKRREGILRSVIGTIFEKKDSERFFTQEQRRIIWNLSDERRCKKCGKILKWEDFTIDHINPHSKGGRTLLNNAAIMCRVCNSSKGSKKVYRKIKF